MAPVFVRRCQTVRRQIKLRNSYIELLGLRPRPETGAAVTL